MSYNAKAQRISIDDADSIYHIKIKEKKLFEVWVEQLGLHSFYRQKLIERKGSSAQMDPEKNTNENRSSPSDSSAK